jgi:hypothetical protein
MSVSNVEAALFYHEMGFCVLPTVPKSARPIFEWGDMVEKNRRFTKAEIDDIYTNNPGLGIQLILGKISGWLYALDFESENGYKLFIDKNPEFADNPIVKTARGYHVYFRLVNNILDHKTVIEIEGEPVELLGNGHLITVPPSIHRKTGQKYRFINKFQKGW